MKHLGNIQVLRFIAAAMVLFGHAQHEVVSRHLGAFNHFEPLNFATGVDLFFVISGFIMYHVSCRKFGTAVEARTFAFRRLTRIVPTYWFFTTLMLLTILLAKSVVVHNQLDPAHIAASYAFIPWPRANGDLRPLLSLGWTLNYEMFFYACFGFSMLLPRRAAIPVLVVGMTGLALIGEFVGPKWGALDFWSDSIILEFLFGIGLAILFERGARLKLPVCIALTVAGFAAMVLFKALGWETIDRAIWGGLPALAVASAFALGPALNVKALELGGDASYALYLSHPFTLNVLALIWRRLDLHGGWLYVSLACMSCIAVSVGVYLWFEIPVQGAIRTGGRSLLPARFLRPRESSSAA